MVEPVQRDSKPVWPAVLWRFTKLLQKKKKKGKKKKKKIGGEFDKFCNRSFIFLSNSLI